MSASREGLIERLSELIADALDVCGREPVGEIRTEDFLPSFLDSVVLSSLLVMIEDEWDFEITDEEIGPEQFETLGTVAGLVERKLSASGA